MAVWRTLESSLPISADCGTEAQHATFFNRPVNVLTAFMAQ